MRAFKEYRKSLVLAAALAFGLAGSGPAWADRGDGAVLDRLDQKAEAFRTWLPQALRGSAHAQFHLGAPFLTGRAGSAEVV